MSEKVIYVLNDPVVNGKFLLITLRGWILTLTVFLADNAIHVMKVTESVCFTNLVTLELRRNRLDTIEDINLPNLRHLFLVKKNSSFDF